MSNAGSIIHMINSLKENRALIKRIKPFQKHKDSDLYKYGITEVEYKTISEEDLLALRKRLRKSRRINDLIMGFAFLICAGIAVGLLLLFIR